MRNAQAAEAVAMARAVAAGAMGVVDGEKAGEMVRGLMDEFYRTR